MATVGWCFTHGHAIQHFFETHPRDAIRELTKASLHVQNNKRRQLMTGEGGHGLAVGIFPIVPHRWGRKACILYLHLLITYRHSPPYRCQPKWRGWICASRNNTSPFFIPSNLCQLQTTMCHCLWTWSGRKEMKVRGEKNRKLPLPSFTFTICPLLVAGNWLF